MVKNPPVMQKTWVWSLGGEDPLEKGMTTHSVFWSGEFHGMYSSWGYKELDMTERLSQDKLNDIDLSLQIYKAFTYY